MKQHITYKQLEGLSDKAKKNLTKWWKPKVGDYCYKKDYPNRTWTAKECIVVATGTFLRDDILSTNQLRLRHFYPIATQINKDMDLYECNPYRIYNEDRGLPISDNKSYLRPFGDVSRYQEYNVYKKDFIPLLSIGQMIEYLDDHSKREKDWDISCKDRLVTPQIETDGLLIQWPHNNEYELKDYLWEAVKEVLEGGE